MRQPKLLIGFLALVGVVLGPSAPSAIALPVYNGTQMFPVIHGPSDPEEYPWEVDLDSEQGLEQVDDQHVAVGYENGIQAFLITAEPAHDVTGANVPTTLSVSAENVITLTVHHRAGSPATGGAPFVYPISAGEGFEPGPSTVWVILPPGEFPPSSKMCHVPKLLGKRLMASRWWLRETGCRMGQVRRPRDAAATKRDTFRVVGQSPKPGVVLPLGTSVQVTLATDPSK